MIINFRIIIQGKQMKFKKFKTKAILFIFAMVFCLCEFIVPKQSVYATEKVTFTVDVSKKQLLRGDEVIYTISMAQNESGAGLDLKFNYDSSVLELQETARGEVFNGASISDLNDVNEGSISATIASLNVLNNGTVFTATFKVKDSAKGKLDAGIDTVEIIDENFEDIECTITDNASDVAVSVPVTGISIDRNNLTLNKGDTEVISSTISPADSDASVSWSSSDTSVATVSEDGTVTAIGGGNATITAKAGAYTATCKVTVVVPLNSIEITGTTDSIIKGQTTKLEIKYNPYDTTDSKEATWSSSDTSVATVSDDGTVKGIKEGTVSVTAKVGDKTAAYEINVAEINITEIQIKDTLIINRGETDTLSVTYIPDNTTDDKTLTWTSADPTIASVDAVTGEITGVKEGIVEITATTKTIDEITNQPVSATVTVTVKENHLTNEIAETITFDDMDTILKGQTLNLNDIINLDDVIEENNITDKISVEWKSSDEDVAIIDSDAHITFLKKGTTEITAVISAQDGSGNKASYEAKITLEADEISLESIAFDKNITQMQVGDSETLNIVYNPENTTDDKNVEWSSSNSDVAVVDNGKITANKVGTAVITAKVGDKSVSCTIEVVEADISDEDDGNGGTADGNGTTGGNGTTDGSGATGGNGTADDNGTTGTGDNGNFVPYIILIICSVAVVAISIGEKIYSLKNK